MIGVDVARPRTGVPIVLVSTEEFGTFLRYGPDSYLLLTFEDDAVPMSETVETPTPPPPAATTAPKSGRGKIAAFAGGAAAIGLVIGLGIGWLGFSNDHHEGRRGGPAMSQQGRGGQGGQNGGSQMPQGRGGNSGGGQMMPGGQGQQMPNGPRGQMPKPDTNAQGGATQQSPQTQPGAVAPN